MATLEIQFANETLTLWRWPTSNDLPSPFDIPHQTAIVLKDKINRPSETFPPSGMVVSAASLGPHNWNTDIAGHLGIPVVLKFATGEENISLLQREATFYENELRRLQGSVVPRCYGLYQGKEDRGDCGLNVSTSCLVLEYCSGHVGGHAMTCSEFKQRAKLAISCLHQAGVGHGKLYDKRNILDLGYRQGIRIVDFAGAYLHECLDAGPGYGMDHGYLGGACGELESIFSSTSKDIESRGSP